MRRTFGTFSVCAAILLLAMLSACARPSARPPTAAVSDPIAPPTTSSKAAPSVPSATATVATIATPTVASTATSLPTATVIPTLSPAPTAPPTATALPTTTPAPATPAPTAAEAAASDQPVSYLDGHILLSMYGRAFGVAPILGRLGSYHSFSDMAKDIQPFIAEIKAVDDGQPVLPSLDIIYGLAVPCIGKDDCLLYSEGQDPHFVDDYIKPAAARGWPVILDTQLGRSDPVTQVNRIVQKGYLSYDNVEVALDPEFHVVPGHLKPGIPIGTIQASQINAVQAILNSYVEDHHLAHKKILIIHQFGDARVNDGVPFMIEDKTALKTFPNVDLVIDADGVGGPQSKVTKYNMMTDAKAYPFIVWRGIKLFPSNPYENASHYDHPLLTMPEVFGKKPVDGGTRIDVPPNVVIIA